MHPENQNGMRAAANPPFGPLYSARVVRLHGVRTVRWVGTACPSSHPVSTHSHPTPKCRDGPGRQAYGLQQQRLAYLSPRQVISVMDLAPCPPSTPEYLLEFHRR